MEMWRTHLDASSLMPDYVSIHHLVVHLVAEGNCIFADTKHANSWQFYHAAISQLTSKPTIKWMKANGYYTYLMTPVLGICDEFKNHSTHNVGNLPEKQPMDNMLNKDRPESVD